MVNAKKIKYLSEKLLYLYLLAFPFGQLLKVEISILEMNINLHPIDIIAVLSIFILIIGKLKYPNITKHIYSFIAASLFSLVFSLTIFDGKTVLIGSLYLLRLISYLSFFIVLHNFIKGRKAKKVYNLLIKVASLIAVLGWIQYLVYPDLRFLEYFGWDDHLYRLVGTFLDPGYTGIILVLGFILVLLKFLKEKDKKLLLLLLFLLISIAFTYARASYLALFAGCIAVGFIFKSIRKYFWWVILFLGLILLLPRPEGEGVKLERLSSVYTRLVDYRQVSDVINKYPLFGVGYNNICEAKLVYTDYYHAQSHSCFGSDSSLLLVFATTGIVGFLIFINMAIQILKSVNNNIYGNAFIASSVALFVNSLFVNSLFYSWIMGWMAILLALAVKNKSREKS